MKRRRSGLSAGLILFSVLFTQVAFAQEPTTEDLKKEIETVKESLKAIQKDVQEIKALLPKDNATETSQHPEKAAKDRKEKKHRVRRDDD